MTTTVRALGGGAQPASIDTSGKVAGGAALRVYGFDSAEAAQAAGYVCEGGPAMSVALITDAQIASGAWKAEGDPAALVVYTAPAGLPVEGGYALPVYPVNGWGSAAPVPVPPLFDSAEVGTVNASTVVVTFDQDVSAADYGAGVTIKVNGATTSITSATRQANHAIVYYVIPVLWHGSGDTVTWEYVEASGNIVAEDDSTPLANVSAQSVTNNCEYAALLDLQADTLVLSDGDPVSTWADQSGQNHNFTQTGTLRPTKRTISTYPAVEFDGVDDYMDGGNWGDNLSNFGLMIVFALSDSIEADGTAPFVIKANYNGFQEGWQLEGGGAKDPELIFADASGNYVDSYGPNHGSNYVGFHVMTVEKLSNAVSHGYFDGSGPGNTVTSGTVSDFSNSSTVKIAATGVGGFSHNSGFYQAIMFFADAPNATNRAALEARLAARYGITL